MIPLQRKSVMVLAMTSAFLLAGCGGNERRDSQPTLATIQPVAMPETSRNLPPADIGEVVEQYQGVLEVTEDAETLVKVQRRLAGLEMLRSEQLQVDGVQAGRYFDQAIELYQALLHAHPQREDNDRLLYQLAKAYELDGRIEESQAVLEQLAEGYPQSAYYIEARFRHGEILFSQQRYGEAETAYRAVLAAGDESRYYGLALYMQGWSQFKQSRYDQALDSFTDVLDRTVPADGQLGTLPRARQEMVQDTLRVMSLAFSYMDGASTIRQYYAQNGSRAYLHLLYRQLGALYLEKERYRDSAGTYASFVEQYPSSDHAPQFSVLLVEVYQQGGFPSEILPAKEDFARRYGIQSDYWQSREAAGRVVLLPHLHTYLDQLARHYHATAQMLQAEHAKVAAAENGGVEAPHTVQVRKAFLTAGNWYAQFAATFPEDDKTPEMVFLMAESLAEAGELPRAIEAYEQVAYGYRDSVNGAEAGYSAILAYRQHAAGLQAEAAESWQLQKIESALRFAESYGSDVRALPVLVSASEELLAIGNSRDAVLAAARVTNWQPRADEQAMRTAWLVQGHGNFQLGNYNDAETAYSGALGVMEEQEEARAAVLDRLAASIYRQAEAHVAIGEQQQAVDDFLRVSLVAAGSDIAAKAHFDGANTLMELQEWQRAQLELNRFRQAYPTHDLSAVIPAKLVHIHQQEEQWRLAADELTTIAAVDEDPQVRRQSLYLAAEYYEKDASPQLAIERYSEYANEWPQPFDMATEARYKLATLHDEAGHQAQRREWLRELMTGHDSAGAGATQRSRYLAAMSAAVFADDAYRDFKSAPLTLPLKRSLKTKKVLMQASLAASERVLAYGVAEFVTEASFRIGDIYASLSTDLMDSERPAELNALELEQYEILLEEQAYPFEEQAIAIHETNARRSWSGVYDQWVQDSITNLARLLPARYGKLEKLVRYSDDIY